MVLMMKPLIVCVHFLFLVKATPAELPKERELERDTERDDNSRDIQHVGIVSKRVIGGEISKPNDWPWMVEIPRTPAELPKERELKRDTERDDNSRDIQHVGIVSKRVIGGEISKPNDWPWMVEILRKQGPYKYTHVCGGALISASWVLTAAHCLLSNKRITDDLVVRLGEHDQTISTNMETNHKIIGFHAHDRFFAEENYAYDIALLKIYPPARFGKYIHTIDLPRLYEQVSVGTRCTLTGWGRMESHGGPKSMVLRQVELPIVSYQTCAAVNDKLPYANVSLFSNICAGGEKTRSGCNGDSGGPLVCKKDGKWTLQGIVSWGGLNCTSRYYSVFTRVSSYVEWIQVKMATPLKPLKTKCDVDYHYYCKQWKVQGHCNYPYIERLCHKTCVGCSIRLRIKSIFGKRDLRISERKTTKAMEIDNKRK